MNTTLIRRYSRERQLGFRASHALHNARTRIAWDMASGVTVSGNDDDHVGHVRLRIEWDDSPYDDSYIETWHDLTESQRDKIKADLWSRIERNGVVGVIGEYWNGTEWVHADSCWGFIGDDWQNSGYDTDIMAATLDAYHDVQWAGAQLAG
jgi:hypothetical protein